MVSLVRTLVALAALGVVGYGLFFVKLDDRPIIAHLADIWKSDVVQDKVDLVKDGVKQKIEDELAEAAADQTRKAVRAQIDGKSAAAAEFDPEDTDALTKMLEAGNAEPTVAQREP